MLKFRLLQGAPGSRLSEFWLHSEVWLNSTIVFHFWGNIKEAEKEIPKLMHEQWGVLYDLIKGKIKCF